MSGTEENSVNPVKVEYPAFLKQLVGEVDAMDENAFTPKWPAKPEERVVDGEMSVYAKKLFALCQFYSRECDSLRIECTYTPCEQHAELHGRIGEAFAKNQLLKMALWGVMRSEFNLWDVPNIGVRQGWKVVTFQVQQAPPNIQDILGGILGQQ